MIAILENKCTGCAVCTLVCPHNVISIVGHKAQLSKMDKCIECGACQLNCEYQAILVTKGTGCLISIIKEDILKIKEKGCG